MQYLMIRIKFHWLAYGILILCTFPAVHAQESADSRSGRESRERAMLEKAVREKAMLGSWLEMQRAATDEATEWQWQKELIIQTLEIYKDERELLLKQIEASSVEKEAQELRSNEEALARAKTHIEQWREKLNALKPRIRSLIAKFPPPLATLMSEEIEFFQSSAEDNDVAETLSMMTRVLSEAERFQRNVTQTTHTIALGEKTYDAKVVYFGLGRAYFLSGASAGVGSPAAEGWEWTERGELREQVALLIEVMEKTEQPQLISLPVQLKP